METTFALGYRLRWLGDAVVLMVMFVGSSLTMVINWFARDKKQ